MLDRSDAVAALVAIATIVNDTANSADERLEGIREVLARVGMLPMAMPPADRTPRTSGQARLDDILKAVARIYAPSSPTPPPSTAKRAPPPKAARKPEPKPKPLLDDPERQERIRREFDAGQLKKKGRARGIISPGKKRPS